MSLASLFSTLCPLKMERTIQSLLPTVLEYRRFLHQFPELSNQEFQTTQKTLELLQTLGGRITTRSSQLGCWLDIGPENKPKIAIRADLDALAIQENTLLSFQSQHKNCMHACGHDVHASCVMGTAMLLRQLAPNHAFRFLFQPAEEVTPGGAIGMIEEGALEGVAHVIAMHCDPSKQVGQVGLKKGALTASNDPFSIELKGKGGHGARPHLTSDLILCSSQIVQALHHAFDRCVDAREPFVISFGYLQAGSYQSPNVLPCSVSMGGTIRSVSALSRKCIEPTFVRVLSGFAQGFDIETPFRVHYGAPAVVNDSFVVDTFYKACQKWTSSENIEWIEQPSMGGEDFSWYLQKIPGAMIRIGSGIGPALHTPQFCVDEEAIPFAMKILAETAYEMSCNLEK